MSERRQQQVARGASGKKPPAANVCEARRIASPLGRTCTKGELALRVEHGCAMKNPRAHPYSHTVRA